MVFISSVRLVQINYRFQLIERCVAGKLRYGGISLDVSEKRELSAALCPTQITPLQKWK